MSSHHDRWNSDKLTVRLIHYGTVFDTVAASCAKVHIDAASSFSNLYFEVPCRSFNGLQIRICDNFNVQMPADLDQFR